MKLLAGTKKVIYADPEAAAENIERARNRGRIFKPVFRVWVISPGGDRASEHTAYSFKAKNLTPRTTTSERPFKWASTEVNETVHAWFETEGEVELTLTQPEEL